MPNKLGEAAGGGRSRKQTGLKARRHSQAASETASLLLELVRAVESLVPEGPHYARPVLRALKVRLGSTDHQPMSETDIAQALAEEDGEPLEDTL